MSDRDVVPEKTDYEDKGEMPKYDDKKPFCIICESDVWVVSVGKTGDWNFKCTNCQQELK